MKRTDLLELVEKNQVEVYNYLEMVTAHHFIEDVKMLAGRNIGNDKIDKLIADLQNLKQKDE